jgi:zinc transporter ZupT
MPSDIPIPYWAAALYAFTGAGAILVGGGVVSRDKVAEHSARGVWPALGAGFLIALGALGALPEACERTGSMLIGVALAAPAFLAILLAHGAGHRDAGHAGHAHGAQAGLSLHDARLAVSGLALHALLDGVAVSAALASQRELGLMVAFFVALHKVPEGATAAALTYASGGDARRARRGVGLVAAASLAGALAIFAVSPILGYALGVAAGVTSGVGVGIASHLFRHDKYRALIGLTLGALIFALGEWLVHN